MFSRRALLGFWLLLCLVPGALLAASDAGGLLIRPIEPCVLLDSSKAGRLAVGERQPLWLDEDGAAAGCASLLASSTAEGTAAAQALVLRAEITNVQGKGRLLAGVPGRELLPILGFGEGAESALLPFALVELCQETAKQTCEEGQLVVTLEGATADLKLEAIGVLEVPSPGGLAGTEQADQEGDSPSTRSTTAPYWDLGLTNSLSYTDGFVGVGTVTPEAPFHVDTGGVGLIVSQPAYFNGETVSNFFEPRYPGLFLRRNSGTRGANLALGNQSGKMSLYGSAGGFKIYDSDSNQRLFLTADGKMSLGQLADPAYTLHVAGDIVFRDPTDSGNVLEILPKTVVAPGYSGGNVFTDTRMLRLLSPYQNSTGGRSRGFLVFGSPEVWGSETGYIYGFGSKNIRIGAANDGDRRAEIEVYNNNTMEGKILFRTGIWRDPNNIPATSTAVRMLIDTGGNVGIGTTTPSQKLEIEGNLKLSGNILSDGDICLGSCN